jgi:predicted nicotinamide N-methyase
MEDQFVVQMIELPGGQIRLLQPRDAAEIPDDHEVEWAPLAPYWSVLWRSGVTLAREVAGLELRGRRVVELGCGLGVPSLAAAGCGAVVLATDRDPAALELLERNARENGVQVETERLEWSDAEALIARAPFDLVLAADVLYERPSVARLLGLLPQLAPEALIAEPGRPAAAPFLEQARKRWTVETRKRGVVKIHKLRFNGPVSPAN